MKAFLVFAAFALASVSALSCKPGAAYLSTDGCNTCVCVDGDDANSACTMKFCLTKEVGTPDFCTPGTSVPAGDGCNSCVCGPEGKATICTAKACGGPSVDLHPPTVNLVGQEPIHCEPHSRFLAPDGCNTCVCSPNGLHAACTMKMCLKPRAGTERLCTPGTSVLADDGCNHCICGANGKATACTLMACL